MTRSWWGWGNVEDAVRGEELDALLSRVRALPSGELTGHEPPDPASLGLPAPRVSPPDALAGLCSADPADRAGARARQGVPRRGPQPARATCGTSPDLVARPRHEPTSSPCSTGAPTRASPRSPTAAAARWSAASSRGRRPSGAVTIDLARARPGARGRSDVSRAARIQAGVYGPALEDQLRPHGLTLRHFPQSFEFSTLGGWLATRSGGHYATLYTHIDDLVESMRVVTPARRSASPGGCRARAPGRPPTGCSSAPRACSASSPRRGCGSRTGPSGAASASVRFADFDRRGRGHPGDRAERPLPGELPPARRRPRRCSRGCRGRAAASCCSAFESADHPVDAWLDRAGGAAPRPRRRGRRRRRPRDGRGRRRDAGAWRSSFLRMPYQRDALARHAA